jgi:methylenetetrahydrofolate reductase (NADPH)
MSRLRRLVEQGDALVITGEAPSVDGGDLDAFSVRVAEVARWADAVNATDNTGAHAHASNVAVAIALVRAGIEPVLQVVCRDKNRVAIQADIVGAALHGVENVCCLTGDDVTAGDEPEARRVFDLDGPQLVSVATTLSRGRYLSGRALEPAPALFVGAVENPAAPPLDFRPRRAAKKVDAGAGFLQLQICYYPERLETFVRSLAEDGLTGCAAILPSVVLVRGARALRFMDEQVPGISVPAETVERVRSARDESEAAYELALEQARHALSLHGVRGLHLIDFRRDGALSQLFTDLGIPTRTERETAQVVAAVEDPVLVGVAPA